MLEEKAKAFKDAKQLLITGTFKFSTEFISIYDLFCAVTKFAEEDKNVLNISIRPSGQNSLAVDIRYKPENLSPEDAYKVFTFERFKPFFEKELKGDYITWWELHDVAYVVK